MASVSPVAAGSPRSVLQTWLGKSRKVAAVHPVPAPTGDKERSLLPSTALYRFTNSTRRFVALPAAVRLSPIGRSCP